MGCDHLRGSAIPQCLMKQTGKSCHSNRSAVQVLLRLCRCFFPFPDSSSFSGVLKAGQPSLCALALHSPCQPAVHAVPRHPTVPSKCTKCNTNHNLPAFTVQCVQSKPGECKGINRLTAEVHFYLGLSTDHCGDCAMRCLQFIQERLSRPLSNAQTRCCSNVFKAET